MNDEERRADAFITRPRVYGVRGLPASLNSATPDNRANLARIVHRLADFLQAFITYRLHPARIPITQDYHATVDAFDAIETAIELVRGLRLFALVALHERWGGAGARMILPMFGVKRSLLGGNVKNYQVMMNRLLLDLASAGDREDCVVHEVWFEMNVMGSLGLTRVYRRRRVVEDPEAMRIAAEGMGGQQLYIRDPKMDSAGTLTSDGRDDQATFILLAVLMTIASLLSLVVAGVFL
ncbi:hypothetical protein M409DRAFT_22158 [Zasmidium cellare ATCC 36951]|uniref:Uncharacterized protein n=1 Tax=Zasmidium cellare ATCC 36951 TaxID=1080233 RepID=A0A6A6CMA4_ZASCE|nr:uncharacterized protein M409DRAFT_22158 [Zasmidium cellare ATCC 36951]KAF2167348.1 hypothetical protein M409DRAFT_22158 [Zasmidium cellare ATCC 36951]